jgi:hypothetical protein
MEIVYWTMKDGKKISIDDMDINHLRNSLKMVVRGLERLEGDIAQDHFDIMMDMEWADEMNYHQGL